MAATSRRTAGSAASSRLGRLGFFAMRSVWRGPKSEPDVRQEITVPPAPINGLLRALLLLESVWLRWFDAPAGSSALCLARVMSGAP
jgi:hypothetical protein